MQINIYKDQMQKAYLFGAPVLCVPWPLPREDVPQGWYCYDLQGTAEDRAEPYRLVDKADKNYAGSVLSYLPLKSGKVKSRLVKDMYHQTGVSFTLNQFCADEKIQCPEIPLRHMMRPASPDETGLFYAQTPEKDEELGAIGHVRIDFGHRGQEFWHTWWPRGPEELNTQEFREELDKVINDLRKGVLKDLSSMRRCCHGRDGAIEGGAGCQNYGFTLETDRYIYRLRCNPTEGDYQAYLGCFDKQAQKLEQGLTEKGAADTGRSVEGIKAMASAPKLEAVGLDGDFRLLAEFNGVVLAGRELKRDWGHQFVTWRRDRDGVAHGNYYHNNYAGAKLDFACRSGLVQDSRQFTDEQLTELYRCIHETLDSEYPITEERRKTLTAAAEQIERSVDDLEERVEQSNQRELEAADQQADSSPGWEMTL